MLTTAVNFPKIKWHMGIMPHLSRLFSALRASHDFIGGSFLTVVSRSMVLSGRFPEGVAVWQGRLCK